MGIEHFVHQAPDEHDAQPAGLPNRPLKPNQLRVMLLAVAAGLALGAALAVGREFMDRSVHDVRALQNEFQVPVLGEIPRIHGAA